MKVNKYSNKGEMIGQVTLPKNLFDCEINSDVLYEVIKLYRGNQRQGTKSVKGRSAIKGSTRKLFRQKGTGRARAGSAKSPTRVGGGVAFGPRPKNWYKKISKKKKRIALKSALNSQKKQVSIIEEFEFEKPKTKNAAQILKNMKVENQKCLIVIPDNSKKVIKSFVNISDTKIIRAQDLCAYEIICSNHLVITEKALMKMKETFK
ncbi:MAG: 50S ribosomal protein L4 [Candidatus Cloacimonetes bacterium]|nr:50S ribosomal protein L4 [Candidatus Cloacimonadota bacterium]MBL7107856.1 50S ribosomal protein L4 [Candidatus Cloacimonadota bacterium]